MLSDVVTGSNEIDRLPVEILRRVFLEAEINLASNSNDDSRKGGVLQVSKRWRTIAIETASLWNSIKIELPSERKYAGTNSARRFCPTNHLAEFLSIWLIRSGDLLLDVEVTSSHRLSFNYLDLQWDDGKLILNDEDEPYGIIWRILIDSSHRWSRVYLNGKPLSTVTYKILHQVGATTFSGIQSYKGSGLNWGQVHLPNLRALNLTDDDCLSELTLPALQSLWVTEVNPLLRRFSDFVKRSPRIQVLRINNVSFLRSGLVEDHLDESLETFLQFPELKRVSGLPVDLLGYAPQLESICVEPPYMRVYLEIPGVIRKSVRDLQLHVSRHNMDDDLLELILPRFPNVESIIIIGIDPIMDPEPDISALMEALASSPLRLVPKLHYLEMMDVDISHHMLLRFCETRESCLVTSRWSETIPNMENASFAEVKHLLSLTASSEPSSP